MKSGLTSSNLNQSNLSPFHPFYERQQNMDADTYYAKINERNTQMKQRRKEQGTYSRESSSDYLSQLNAVNRTGEGEENPYSDSGYESSD